MLSATDFVGEFKLSQNAYDVTEINMFITQFEELYLRDLLGDNLYKDFIAGLAAGTVLQKWTDLQDGCYYKIIDDENSTETNDIFQVKFEGVKKMLKYFIWFEYVNKNQQKHTIAGQVVSNTENGTMVSGIDLTKNLINMYNKGVDIYNQAIDFLTVQNDYTDIVSIVGTLVTTIRTKYLANADTVTINSTTYTIGTLSADVSFVTNVAASGTTWQKYFYPNFTYKTKDKIIW
jgi:hypothetical protein